MLDCSQPPTCYVFSFGGPTWLVHREDCRWSLTPPPLFPWRLLLLLLTTFFRTGLAVLQRNECGRFMMLLPGVLCCCASLCTPCSSPQRTVMNM